MTIHIEPVPFEDSRWFAWSGTDPIDAYIVDTQWQEEPWHKPKPFCGCPEMMAKHKKTCKHLDALNDYLSR